MYLSGKMPQLQTADGHRLAVMGTVQAQLQFQHFSTKHEFLVTNKSITPVILGIGFLSKHIEGVAVMSNKPGKGDASNATPCRLHV